MEDVIRINENEFTDVNKAREYLETCIDILIKNKTDAMGRVTLDFDISGKEIALNAYNSKFVTTLKGSSTDILKRLIANKENYIYLMDTNSCNKLFYDILKDKGCYVIELNRVRPEVVFYSC